MKKQIHNWLDKQNLNRLVQEICALLIGLGIGLYAYESNAALVPVKWQVESRVADSLSTQAMAERGANEPSRLKRFFEDVPVVEEFFAQTGAERYLQHLGRYVDEMENLGISGTLKNKMDSLLKEGVQTVPKRWQKPENRPFVVLGLSLIVLCFFLKIAIYANWLDLEKRKRRIKRRGSADFNGIVQEVATLGLSLLGGIYLLPALENSLRGEQTSYPYPLLGLVIFASCLFLKVVIYSQWLDINSWRAQRQRGQKGKLFSWQRLKGFSRHYDWNNFLQQMTTIFIGIALGIYAYDSKLALLPIKWQMDKEVAQEIKQQNPQGESSGLFSDIFSQTPKILQDFWEQEAAARYRQYVQKYEQTLSDWGIKGRLKGKIEDLFEQGVDPIPQHWKKKENLPYLLAFLGMFLTSVAIKLFLYLSVVDINQLARGKSKRKRSYYQQAQWNEVFLETSSILFSTLLGIYSEPILDYLAGQSEVSFPYSTIGPAVMLACLICHFIFRYKIVDLNRPSLLSKNNKKTPRPAKKSRQRSGPSSRPSRRPAPPKVPPTRPAKKGKKALSSKRSWKSSWKKHKNKWHHKMARWWKKFTSP